MATIIDLHIAGQRPFADGHAFGGSGAYERVTGRVHFAIEPESEVVDLDKAPRDGAGRVHYVADFMILKPVDSGRGNKRVFFDYGNRGNKRALQFFNDAPHSNDPLSLAHAGNGYLMRRGYAVVWLAWEGDILPGDGRLVLDVPVASDFGAPITGSVRVEYIADAPGIVCYPLSGRASAHSYATASMDTRDAVFTRRRYPYDPPEVIRPDQWEFALAVSGSGVETKGPENAVVPSGWHIHYPAGFQPGWIHELVYIAKNPKVMGLGHAAVRDFVSFLKYDDSAVNPLRGTEKAYGWGRSQTGRCIRDFVYRGFNADLAGRRVFDGVMPHVAGAGRKWLNHRFASPIVSGGQQYEDHFNIADSFPFSYAWSTDHLTGQRDAILQRPETDPLVFHTQTATEYWVRRGSLVHTDTLGNDLPQPETVRVYFWASSQHSANPLLGAPERGAGHHYSNNVHTSPFFRAMLDAMDNWASRKIAPPDSVIPSRSDGMLVDYESWRMQFPAIPGALTTTGPNRLPLLDFGPEAGRGILREPPALVHGRNDPDGHGLAYTVLVPSVDHDGNDIAGVRAPMAAVPLGTYTGWNPRAHGFGHGMQWRFEGSYIPFSETPSERAATGDPRVSITERYPDASAYVRAIEAAARELVARGLMLEEDVARVVAMAADWGRPRHAISLTV